MLITVMASKANRAAIES